ncbi:MAG: hypothetical protein J6L73_07895 [Muribaculaceae bacterium]|nr:hypothetical protein [Muribaculaceae bacterium]
MKLFYALLIGVMSVSFAACGDDDDDQPANPAEGTVTNYGLVKDTGVQTISLFLSASNGESALNIPGFATIRESGHYNVYTRVIDSISLYSEGDCEFAEWKPGTPLPSVFSEEGSYYNNMNLLVRTKIKNSSEYVYAYIEKTRSLAEATGEMKESLMGLVLKYQSPIDPATFKGFNNNLK